jgi:hypothetical protein
VARYAQRGLSPDFVGAETRRLDGRLRLLPTVTQVSYKQIIVLVPLYVQLAGVSVLSFGQTDWMVLRRTDGQRI